MPIFYKYYISEIWYYYVMNKQFLLIFDNLQQLLNIVCNYKTVHVFVDESVDLQMQTAIFAALNTRVTTIKTVVAPCYATTALASSLLYRGEDFVIAMGKLHLQSLVKYYSYANNLEYGVIPVKEVAEYSFNKYAFIKDKYFCFYLCQKPAFAYIDSSYFTQQDIFNLEKILSYKNIVMYEKEFESLILQQKVYNLTNIVKNVNLCDGSCKHVIKLYSAISLVLEDCKTSEFLGCEYSVLSLLNTNKKDISANLISCTNLLARFYECFNKFNLIRVTPNFNKHIMLLKKEYGLGISDTSTHILSLFSGADMHKIEYTLKAYKPHLLEFFNICKSDFMFSKMEFNSKELEIALALSSGLSGNKTLLRVTRDFGYFENLLK